MTANILIVDDLEPNIKLLEAKLLSEYYTVFSANSALRALQVLDENKIDVILLDVMMPEMDGFECCRRIKANPATTHIPVVMVTALSDIENRIKGLEAGADEFLTKPINDIALFARVKSLSRMKMLVDELRVRNKTNLELGLSEIYITEHFETNQILLINDDIVQNKQIIRSISKITTNIRSETSFESIKDFETKIYDAIIISCQLEIEDPLRITVMIKSKENFRHTIIMFLTEEENMKMVMRGMELGINDYFLYPVDESELIARLKTQLRRKLYQDNLRSELEQSIDLSIKDGLTGVFNRHYLDSHLEQIISKGEPNIHLLMLDIDHFKQVNDTYGHQAGDAVLKEITLVAKNLLRATDLIARFGGEEFVIILSNIDNVEAINVAQRLRKAIESTEISITNLNLKLHKTVSIGLAKLSRKDSLQSIIGKADKALYKAKEGGRNCLIVAD